MSNSRESNRSKKGNILFISNFNGATFTFIADRELIIGLSRTGYSMFTVAEKKRSEIQMMEDNGVKVSYLPAGAKNDKRVITGLRSIIIEKRIDIIHVTYSKALKNILKATRGLQVKIVTFYGSFGLHWHDPSSWFSYLHPNIDKIICVSDAVEKHVKKQLPKRRRNRTIRIYRGYESKWFDGIIGADMRQYGVLETDFLICSIAIVRKIKGIEYLIDAANHLPKDIPVKIMLVGDGTDSKYITKKIMATKRPEMFIQIGHASISPEYSSVCDLYIQPSVSEGLGRAIIEAMCMAKPVIATNGGGLVELFRQGDNGFVVPHSDSGAIAGKILECYKYRTTLNEVGEKARITIDSLFSLSETVRQTSGVYVELLDQLNKSSNRY